MLQIVSEVMSRSNVYELHAQIMIFGLTLDGLKESNADEEEEEAECY